MSSREEELLAALDHERRRADVASALLRDVAASRTGRLLGGLHRLTKRGLDLDAVGRTAATAPAPAPAVGEARVRGIADDFLRLYYEAKAQTWQATSWMGHLVQKLPLDVWLVQELIVRDRVNVVVETGTLYGGSALYYAHLFDLIGEGRVISVDVTAQPNRPEHPRIEYLLGDSVQDPALSELRSRLGSDDRVMVVLDSDHSEAHVTRELDALADLVTVGCPLIVEDTIINGHPVRPDFGPGPMEAVLPFLERDDRFEPDPDAEKFLTSFNKHGILRRVR